VITDAAIVEQERMFAALREVLAGYLDELR
jgi:hypothetical protein